MSKAESRLQELARRNRLARAVTESMGFVGGHPFALRFKDGDDDAATKAAADAAAAAAANDKKDVKYEDAQRLIEERDRAKEVNRAIVEGLGLKVNFVEDDKNPGKKRVVIDGLDDLKNLRTSAETAKEEALKKAGKWEERKAELEKQHTEKLTAIQTTSQKQVGGLRAYIESRDVVDPLRQALKAEGVIDPDGKGEFSDYVELLRKGVRVQVDTDEENGSVKKVEVTPIGEDGKPLTDGKGNVLTVRQFVAQWAAARPGIKGTTVRRGPGAGGYGRGVQPPAGDASTPAARGQLAGDLVFGAKP